MVNRVYPLFVIVGHPDDLDRKVMEKGVHEKLERVRPKGAPRRLEQYSWVPVGHPPVVK